MSKFRDCYYKNEDFLNTILDEDVIMERYTYDVSTDLINEAAPVGAPLRKSGRFVSKQQTARFGRLARARDEEAKRKIAQRKKERAGTRLGPPRKNSRRRRIHPMDRSMSRMQPAKPDRKAPEDKPAQNHTPSQEPQATSRRRYIDPTTVNTPISKKKLESDYAKRRRKIKTRLAARKEALNKDRAHKGGIVKGIRAAFMKNIEHNKAKRPVWTPENRSSSPIEFVISINEDSQDSALLSFDINESHYELEVPTTFIEVVQEDIVDNGISEEYADFMCEEIWKAYEADLGEGSMGLKALFRKGRSAKTSVDTKINKANREIYKRAEGSERSSFGKNVGLTGKKIPREPTGKEIGKRNKARHPGKKPEQFGGWDPEDVAQLRSDAIEKRARKAKDKNEKLKSIERFKSRQNEAKSTTEEESLQLTGNTNVRRKPEASFYDLFQNLKGKHGVNNYRIAKALTGKKLTFGLGESAPPGEEKLVHQLKKEYGWGSKAEKAKVMATAWKIYNKKKGK